MKSPRASQKQPGPPAAVLSLSDPQSLQQEVHDVQVAIARRAYELFENRGREHGRDWEDWFQAESELLRTVSVAISELEELISVRGNVLGFDENELQVAVEPLCVTIIGKKKISTTETEGGKVEYIDWYPDQILRVINLPAEVIPDQASLELQGGVVTCELPKTGDAVKVAGQAA